MAPWLLFRKRGNIVRKLRTAETPRQIAARVRAAGEAASADFALAVSALGLSDFDAALLNHLFRCDFGGLGASLDRLKLEHGKRGVLALKRFRDAGFITSYRQHDLVRVVVVPAAIFVASVEAAKASASSPAGQI